MTEEDIYLLPYILVFLLITEWLYVHLHLVIILYKEILNTIKILLIVMHFLFANKDNSSLMKTMSGFHTSTVLEKE